ncbi:MAG: MipA/OmpV family protein [Candidatus Omnitrophica bacterium]|nr:MipA/OmpV family protein [Candidatus Omnitrophota bacterium]
MITVLFLASNAPALAYETSPDSNWKVTLGLGGIIRPEYEGSDSYEGWPLPYIDLKYKDRFFLNPWRGIGLDLYKNEELTVGTALGFDFGRDEEDDALLQGMGDVGETVELGLFAEYKLDPLTFGLDFAQDIADGHGGFTLGGSLGSKFALPDHSTFLMPSLNATFASENYMESYFGVDHLQAVRSSLAFYDVESGIKDVGASLRVLHRLDNHWSVVGFVSYSRLVGDAADSPVVAKENQFTGGSFLTYTF